MAMELTSKTAKRIEEINLKIFNPAFVSDERWMQIVRVEKQSIINFKNELKDMLFYSLSGVDFQIKVEKLIEEIESVEKQ